MTLDEAINNFMEAAKNHRYEQQYWQNERDETSPLYEADRFRLADDSRESAEYYEQLAEWLTELKELRETHNAEVSIGGFFEDTNKILVDRIKELEEENEEAKRLLKLAVEDLAKIPCNNDVYIPSSCDVCEKKGNCDYSESFKWRYTDEALKLIGGEQND